MYQIKKWKKLLLYVLLVCMIQTTALPFTPAVTVEAAVKNGLKTENGKLYYYKNGVKVTKQLVRINAAKIYFFGSNGSAVTNTFKKIVDLDGRKYGFYFGATGKAIVAPKVLGQEKNFVVKKINGVYYGFDTLGHLIRGMWVDSEKGTLSFFDTNGAYNAAQTKTLRAAIRKFYGKKPASETGYKNVYTYLKTALGKHKVIKTSSCMIWGKPTDGYTDVTMQFTNFCILLIRNNRTKQYYFYDIYSR